MTALMAAPVALVRLSELPEAVPQESLLAAVVKGQRVALARQLQLAMALLVQQLRIKTLPMVARRERAELAGTATARVPSGPQRTGRPFLPTILVFVAGLTCCFGEPL
jgi:hypothetical protein